MANEEHLAILQQGVEAWNVWRQENPDVRPDLIGANFARADLTGINFQRGNLQWTFLGETILSRGNFQQANLEHANLSGAILTGATLTQAHLQEATLAGADFTKANLSGAFLNAANLSGAILRDVNLASSDLSRSILKRTNLSGAILTGATLTRAHLQEATLAGADFTKANLSGAFLNAANLSGAILQGANLSGADLSGAILFRSVLTETDFTKAILLNTNMKEARVGWAVFVNVDLRKVQGLATMRHSGPSTIGIDTIYLSQGAIPDVFLRGAGIPDLFITYIPSLTAKPIQFYSCFISYSNADQACAERLHADLQNRGVRCWYAPYDMQIGEPILSGIDRAIRLYDKLLLILSESSVESGWVEQEVHMALAREKIERRRVLFPIRVDDTVMDSQEGWPAVVRNTIHIGDFRQWKEHDAYQIAFARLLRDLRAE